MGGNGFQRFFERSPQSAALLATNGTILSVNRQTLALLGLEEADLLGLPLWRSPWFDRDQEAHEELRACVASAASGASCSCKVALTTPPGEPISGRIHFSPALDGRGRIERILVVVIDDTRYEQAAESLRRSEEMFAAAFRISPLPMVLMEYEPELGSRFVEVNTAFEEFTGRPAEAVIGRRITELTTSVFSLADREDLALRLNARGEVLEREITISTLIRGHRICHLSAKILHLGGKPHVLGIFSDITAERRAEEMRRQQERFTSALVETVGALIVVLDTDGRIVRFNKACEEISGYSRYEVMGRRVWDFLVRAEEIEASKAAFDGIKSGRLRDYFENHWVARDGRQALIEWTNTALRGEGGDVEFLIATGRDVTEKREIEEKLRRREQILQEQRTALLEIVRHSALGSVFDFDQAMSLLTSTTARTLGAECVCVGRLDPSRTKLTCIASSRAEYRAARAKRLPWSDLVREDAPAYFEALEVDFLISATNMAEDPRTKSMPEGFWRCRGAGAALDAAIVTGETVRGVLAVHHMGAPRRWSPEELTFVVSLANLAALMFDLHEKRTLVQARRETEAQVDQLMNQAPDPILLVDTEGQILKVNRQACLDLGYAEAELRSMMLHEFDADYSPGRYTRFWQDLCTKGELTVQASILHRQGTRFLGEVHAGRVSVGGRDCALLLIRNVTARALAEAELAASHHALRALTSELAIVEARERRRVATYLHDQIGQSLAAAQIKLGLINGGTLSEEQAEGIREIRTLLGHVIEDTRTLTRNISPPVLHELGIEAALEELAQQVSSEYDLKFEFEDDGRPKPIDPDLSEQLFRAARELMMNVVKHAAARWIRVAVRADDGRICVSVEDDGVGFDPAASQPVSDTQHFGLFSIREQLGFLGGRLEIDSRPGQGTRASLIAPLGTDGLGRIGSC